jgi:hypothetical protein
MVESKQILAIDGGAPVRSVPLPEESPGIHYFGTEEQESVMEVLRNRSPFRFYGPELSNKCLDLEDIVCRKYDVRHSIAINSGTSGIYIGPTQLLIRSRSSPARKPPDSPAMVTA